MCSQAGIENMHPTVRSVEYRPLLDLTLKPNDAASSCHPCLHYLCLLIRFGWIIGLSENLRLAKIWSVLWPTWTNLTRLAYGILWLGGDLDLDAVCPFYGTDLGDTCRISNLFKAKKGTILWVACNIDCTCTYMFIYIIIYNYIVCMSIYLMISVYVPKKCQNEDSSRPSGCRCRPTPAPSSRLRSVSFEESELTSGW